MEETLQNLLRKIDGYIEESLDENFDRFLEHMKRILAEHPEQKEDVARSVEENMERYRRNQAHLKEELERREKEAVPVEPETVSGEPETVPVEPETVSGEPETVSGEPESVSGEPETVPGEPESVSGEPETVSGEPETVSGEPEAVRPDPAAGRATAKPQGSSAEYKIGIGVLSAIGVLFVLVGLVILVRNFLPDVVQGMMMLCFFALVWIASQFCLSRFGHKLFLGGTAAGITGMYLAVIMNYYTFGSFPDWLTLGLLLLTGVIAWAAGRTSGSAVIQCTGAVGFLFFWLYLPWGDSLWAYLVMLAAAVLLNVLWQMGAKGEYIYVVRMTHQIAFVISMLISAVLLSLRDIPGEEGPLFLYCVVAVILLNLFYLGREDVGFMVVWICGTVLLLAYLAGVWFATIFAGDYWWNCLFLLLAAANVAFLLLKKFQWRYHVFYYQAAGVLLLLACSDETWWVGLLATVALFLVGIWKIREHSLLQEMIMLGVLTVEVLSIPTDFAFMVSLFLMVLAILAIVAGFVRCQMPLRIFGLCLSLFACAKVVLYDFWDLELLEKSLLFLGVGLIAIAIALVYAVLEHQQKKKRMESGDSLTESRDFD